MPGTGRTRPRLGLIILAAVVFLLLALSSGIATFYTDLLWFADLGHVNVVWVSVVSQLVTGLVFGLLTFAILYVNIVVARRMAPKVYLSSVGDASAQFEQALMRVKGVLEPVAGWVLLLGSGLLALANGAAMASDWPSFQLVLHAVPFGQVDPQFGRDVAFYVFSLPALRIVSDWLTGVLVLALLVTAGVHVYDGAIRPWERLRGFAPHVKAHLSVLAALIVASRAFAYWIEIYMLDLSPRGQVIGASFTDVNAQLPAYVILIGITIVSAVILLANIRFRGWRLPVIALGVWFGAAVLVGWLYPSLVQQFRVAPNEVAAESPYIARNIASTRKAFALDDVVTRMFAADANLTAADVASDSVTLANVRLWDPSIVKQTYKQLQEIRTYYDFNDVDVDRYTIDGTRQEVLVSVREMNVASLASEAKTWVNQTLRYTHGYGAVVSPVNDVAPSGGPAFIVKDLPPASSTDLTISQPAVYYGEETADYVVAGSGLPEFDYPKGSDNATTSYAGKTGVPVGGLLRRLAFALRFGSTDLLLSGYVTPQSKVLMNREIRDRVSRLAPFLTLDADPYAAIVGGRIVWILDGYTTSSMYPYSQPAEGGVNYIRNSVKVTVDAYDGTTTLYAFDPKDPVLAAWRGVFPGLVQDASSMPDGVRAHLRYPEDLFRVQAEVYKNYHMLEPQVFYNKEDSWAIPGESAGSPMKPFYVLMKVPGESSQDFLMMLPFTPRGKDNMNGWMAAGSDPGRYGRRLVYQFPKQKLVLGPQQISARVNQEPTISAQLSLWNQRGSSVLFGNLLVIPIKDAIVYIQPLYLQAEQTAIPQLTRVIVAYGDRVAMEPDLQTALAGAFGFGQQRPVAAGRPAGGAQTTGTPGARGAASADLELARSLYGQALAAQKAGDWAGYGRLIGQLGQVLDRLAGSSPTTAAPTR